MGSCLLLSQGTTSSSLLLLLLHQGGVDSRSLLQHRSMLSRSTLHGDTSHPCSGTSLPRRWPTPRPPSSSSSSSSSSWCPGCNTKIYDGLRLNAEKKQLGPRMECLETGIPRHTSQRSFAVSVGLDEQSSSFSKGDNSSYASETNPIDTIEKPTSRILTSEELKALLADSERRKLIRKLSEANQYNRFLKRQLYAEETALNKFKNELAVLELELQALVSLAEKIANVVPANSRKIKGKYIQSLLLSRLEAAHAKLKEQIEDVDSLKFHEIDVFWVGMAESVQVMGSFDGWTEGEEMSPEYGGVYANFSAKLKLRPGRYEIKFLVDGEWHLSPVFPTVGEGMMKNNLLVVE